MKKAKTHNKGTDGDNEGEDLGRKGCLFAKLRAPFGATNDHRPECKLASAIQMCVAHPTCWLVSRTGSKRSGLQR